MGKISKRKNNQKKKLYHMKIQLYQYMRQNEVQIPKPSKNGKKQKQTILEIILFSSCPPKFL